MDTVSKEEAPKCPPGFEPKEDEFVPVHPRSFDHPDIVTRKEVDSMKSVIAENEKQQKSHVPEEHIKIVAIEEKKENEGDTVTEQTAVADEKLEQPMKSENAETQQKLESMDSDAVAEPLKEGQESETVVIEAKDSEDKSEAKVAEFQGGETNQLQKSGETNQLQKKAESTVAVVDEIDESEFLDLIGVVEVKGVEIESAGPKAEETESQQKPKRENSETEETLEKPQPAIVITEATDIEDESDAASPEARNCGVEKVQQEAKSMESEGGRKDEVLDVEVPEKVSAEKAEDTVVGQQGVAEKPNESTEVESGLKVSRKSFAEIVASEVEAEAAKTGNQAIRETSTTDSGGDRKEEIAASGDVTVKEEAAPPGYANSDEKQKESMGQVEAEKNASEVVITDNQVIKAEKEVAAGANNSTSATDEGVENQQSTIQSDSLSSSVNDTNKQKEEDVHEKLEAFVPMEAVLVEPPPGVEEQIVASGDVTVKDAQKAAENAQKVQDEIAQLIEEDSIKPDVSGGNVQDAKVEEGTVSVEHQVNTVQQHVASDSADASVELTVPDQSTPTIPDSADVVEVVVPVQARTPSAPFEDINDDTEDSEAVDNSAADLSEAVNDVPEDITCQSFNPTFDKYFKVFLETDPSQLSPAEITSFMEQIPTNYVTPEDRYPILFKVLFKIKEFKDKAIVDGSLELLRKFFNNLEYNNFIVQFWSSDEFKGRELGPIGYSFSDGQPRYDFTGVAPRDDNNPVLVNAKAIDAAWSILLDVGATFNSMWNTFVNNKPMSAFYLAVFRKLSCLGEYKLNLDGKDTPIFMHFFKQFIVDAENPKLSTTLQCLVNVCKSSKGSDGSSLIRANHVLCFLMENYVRNDEKQDTYMSALRRLFDSANGKLTINWSFESSSFDNPQVLLVNMIKFFNRSRSILENNSIIVIMKCLKVSLEESEVQFETAVAWEDDDAIDWPFTYSILNHLKIHTFKLKIPEANYLALPENGTHQFECVKDADENPTLETALIGIFEAFFCGISSTDLPDILYKNLWNVYPLSSSMANLFAHAIITSFMNLRSAVNISISDSLIDFVGTIYQFHNYNSTDSNKFVYDTDFEFLDKCNPLIFVARALRIMAQQKYDPEERQKPAFNSVSPLFSPLFDALGHKIREKFQQIFTETHGLFAPWRKGPAPCLEDETSMAINRLIDELQKELYCVYDCTFAPSSFFLDILYVLAKNRKYYGLFHPKHDELLRETHPDLFERRPPRGNYEQNNYRGPRQDDFGQNQSYNGAGRGGYGSSDNRGGSFGHSNDSAFGSSRGGRHDNFRQSYGGGGRGGYGSSDNHRGGFDGDSSSFGSSRGGFSSERGRGDYGNSRGGYSGSSNNRGGGVSNNGDGGGSFYQSNDSAFGSSRGGRQDDFGRGGNTYGNPRRGYSGNSNSGDGPGGDIGNNGDSGGSFDQSNDSTFGSSRGGFSSDRGRGGYSDFNNRGRGGSGGDISNNEDGGHTRGGYSGYISANTRGGGNGFGNDRGDSHGDISNNGDGGQTRGGYSGYMSANTRGGGGSGYGNGRGGSGGDFVRGGGRGGDSGSSYSQQPQTTNSSNRGSGYSGYSGSQNNQHNPQSRRGQNDSFEQRGSAAYENEHDTL